MGVMRIFILTFCLIVGGGQLFAATAPQTAPLTAHDWSVAVQKRYANTKTMHVFFEQKITHAESATTEARQGEIYFQKPLWVRWTTKPPHEELLLVTDKLIWQYFPDEELAYKYTVDAIDDKNAFLRVLFGLSSLEDSFEITILPGENKLARLKLDPYEPSTSLLEAYVWIEPDSATIRRLSIKDFYGNLSEINMSKIDFNPAIPAKTFSFTPPEGTEIEDHTK
jgi:outer membrane lipoprotein carrier protein